VNEVIPTRYGYFVSSASVPGAFRRVTDRYECSCPATTDRCRHVRMVMEVVKAEDARKRRPSAPAHVSALVD
jgi:hypothetical protein